MTFPAQTTPESVDISLDTKSAAQHLNLKPQTLCNWRHQRRGPAYHKLGGRIVYRKSDLNKFLAAGRIDPGAHDVAAEGHCGSVD